MYDVKPNLLIGFHGCDRMVRDQLLMNPNDYRISRKPYDWLGHGLYFWENNYDRALEFYGLAGKKLDQLDQQCAQVLILCLPSCYR
jgi:hypothetical protein